MIKVLQILQGGTSFGGVENFLCQYYKHIDKSLVTFDFVFISEDSMKDKWHEDFLKESNHVSFNLKVTDTKGIYKALLHYLNAHKKYDCVHINTGNITIQYPCLVAAKKSGIKCRIAHSHSTGSGNTVRGLKNLLRSYLQHKIYKDSTIHAGCSYEAAQHLFGEKVSPKSVAVIPNAIDTALYKQNDAIREEVRKEFGLKDEKTFIQVGSIYEVKNHTFTLDVFGSLDNQFKDWKLIIVGEGVLKEQVREKAEHLGLSEKIIFTGFRNDVYRLLQAADCLLVPSLWEGFSLSSIEGQTANLAVLCSVGVPRAADVIGNCKFLPLDVSDWVRACMECERGTEEPYLKVIEAGFDIHDAASKLTRIYMDSV